MDAVRRVGLDDEIGIIYLFFYSRRWSLVIVEVKMSK